MKKIEFYLFVSCLIMASDWVSGWSVCMLSVSKILNDHRRRLMY